MICSLFSILVRKYSVLDPDWNSRKKMVENKLVSFAIIVALWTLQCNFTYKANHRILLKRKHIQGKHYTILVAMMQKQSFSVKIVSISETEPARLTRLT